MSISGVSGDTRMPAFLPLRRAAGSGFADSLRARIRAEAADLIAGEWRPAAEPAVNAGRAAALQQSLLTRRSTITATGPWAEQARAIAGQYLPPDAADVFARQMALESNNFDPDVIAGRRVSAAGAEGIAQLMPSSYPNINRLDPVASLHAAAGTMAANLQQFGGDLGKALAAYNAGGGRVAAEVARRGADWESGLPQETRFYLRELLGGTHG